MAKKPEGPKKPPAARGPRATKFNTAKERAALAGERMARIEAGASPELYDKLVETLDTFDLITDEVDRKLLKDIYHKQVEAFRNPTAPEEDVSIETTPQAPTFNTASERAFLTDEVLARRGRGEDVTIFDRMQALLDSFEKSTDPEEKRLILGEYGRERESVLWGPAVAPDQAPEPEPTIDARTVSTDERELVREAMEEANLLALNAAGDLRALGDISPAEDISAEWEQLRVASKGVRDSISDYNRVERNNPDREVALIKRYNEARDAFEESRLAAHTAALQFLSERDARREEAEARALAGEGITDFVASTPAERKKLLPSLKGLLQQVKAPPTPPKVKVVAPKTVGRTSRSKIPPWALAAGGGLAAGIGVILASIALHGSADKKKISVDSAKRGERAPAESTAPTAAHTPASSVDAAPPTQTISSPFSDPKYHHAVSAEDEPARVAKTPPARVSAPAAEVKRPRARRVSPEAQEVPPPPPPPTEEEKSWGVPLSSYKEPRS